VAQALDGVDAHGLDRADVAALGVSGQQHGLVPLSHSGDVLANAKLWCDTEASEQAERLSERLGWRMPPAFTAAKLLWLQERCPDVYQRLAHVLLPHDYINYWLTGEMAMEVRRAPDLKHCLARELA
jgi:xylulokinase